MTSSIDQSAAVSPSSAALEKNASQRIERKQEKSLWQLLQPLKAPLIRNRRLLGLTILAGWGKFAAPVAIPLIIGGIIDMLVGVSGVTVTAAAMQGHLAFYGPILMGLIVLISVSTYFRSALAQRLSARVQHHLRKRLFFHMQRLSVSFFHKHHAGALGSRVSSDINHSAVILNKGVIQWAMDGVALILTISIIFYFNWILALITVGLLAINGIVIRKLGPPIRIQRKAIQERQSSVTGCAAEYFAGISVVKAYAGEGASSKNFSDTSRTVRDAQVVNSTLQGRFQGMTQCLVLLTQVAVVFVGAWMITFHPELLSHGELVTFLLYVGHVNGSVQRLADSMMELQDGVAALDRINDILSIYPSPPEAKNPVSPVIKGDLCFDHVTFGYDKRNPVLHDFSYHFEQGKSYALVGPSGGGKSTVTQLMLRFYDPQEGSISIDGHDLRTVAKPHYRSHVAVVLQDPIIFSGNVLDNIGFADVDASPQRIKAAAEAAQAHDFIAELPQGYHSRLGERGVALSGGQRQRIAIARALMRDPKLLILDEATSALDTVTERAIQNMVEELHGTRTMIVIAHRLSTIRNVDRILVVEDGHLIEEGSFDELIAAGGAFAELAEEQEQAD